MGANYGIILSDTNASKLLPDLCIGISESILLYGYECVQAFEKQKIKLLRFFVTKSWTPDRFVAYLGLKGNTRK